MKKVSIAHIASVLLGLMIGCSTLPTKTQLQEPIDVQLAEATVTAASPVIASHTPEPSLTQTPHITETHAPISTNTPNAAESAQFLSDLDKCVFVDYVTSNGYTLQRCLLDPSAYGIEETEAMQTWGSFTNEKATEKSRWAEDQLKELALIDRESLTERDQLTYDTLETYLQRKTKSDKLFYQQDPLMPEGGYHVQIPLILSQYRLNTKNDIDNYLRLVSDLPRFFEELLVHQQERAKMGLFMTRNALDQVLRDCKEIADGNQTAYLKDSFSAALSEIDDLSRAERNTYLEQQSDALQTFLIPSYEQLYSGLQALMESCRAQQGVYVLGDLAMEQYAFMLAEEAASDISPEDALSLLDNALSDLSDAMQTIRANNPSIEKNIDLKGKISVSKMLQELQDITKQVMPKVSEDVSIEVYEIPKSLAEVSPIAYCSIPPIDLTNVKIEIALNPHKKDDMLLLTLSHEGWPGHLYQIASQRTLKGIGLLQQVLPLPGYYEGWAQMAEEWMLLEQTRFDQDSAMYAFSNSMLSDAILPSIVSILVNYYGYEREDIQEYLAQYHLQEDAYVDLYYDYAVTCPYSALRYGIGYAQFAALMRDVSASMGERYLQKNVQQRYLDFGPSYFHLIQERMDEWADTYMPE